MTDFLPPFGIRNTDCSDTPFSVLQLSNRQYDETLKTFPDKNTALLWHDHNDGETVTVGSSLELKERLEDPQPLDAPIVDVFDLASKRRINARIHLFDIAKSRDSADIWRERQLVYQQAACVASLRQIIDDRKYAGNFTSPTYVDTETILNEQQPILDQETRKPEAPANIPKSIMESEVGFLGILEGTLNTVADVLQNTSTTLRKVAEKTRDTDTSTVEDVLSGMSTILGEAGAFGLDMFEKLNNEFATACNTAPDVPAITDISYPVSEPKPTENTSSADESVQDMYHCGTSFLLSKARRGKLQIDGCEDFSTFPKHSGTGTGPQNFFKEANERLSDLTANNKFMYESACRQQEWFQKSQDALHASDTDLSNHYLQQVFAESQNRQNHGSVETEVASEQCKAPRTLGSSWRESTSDPDVQALEHQSNNQNCERNPSFDHANPASTLTDASSPTSQNTWSGTKDIACRCTSPSEGISSFQTTNSSQSSEEKPTAALNKESLQHYKQLLEDLEAQGKQSYCWTKPQYGQTVTDLISSQTSILDQDADDADFRARFPPLKSIQVPKTVPVHSCDEPKEFLAAKHSSTSVETDKSKASVRPSPHVFDAETARRREFAKSCFPDQHYIPGPGAVASKYKNTSVLPSCKQPSHGSLRPQISISCISTPKSASQEQGEMASEAEGATSTTQRSVPGAWPSSCSDQKPNQIPESSGAFFHRMMNRTGNVQNDSERETSTTHLSRHRSLNERKKNIHTPSGLRRSQTVIAANPAARLNGPFDPLLPITCVSDDADHGKKSSEAPSQPESSNAPVKSSFLPARPRSFLERPRSFSPVWEDDSSSGRRVLHNARSSATLNTNHDSQPTTIRDGPKRMRSVPIFAKEAKARPRFGNLGTNPPKPVPQQSWQPFGERSTSSTIPVSSLLRSDSPTIPPNMPQTTITTSTTELSSAIISCESQLRSMGYGVGNPSLSSRLHVYAAAANGDVIEAVELIEEDKQASLDSKDGIVSQTSSTTSPSSPDEIRELRKALELSMKHLKTEQERTETARWEESELERVLKNSKEDY